MPVWTRNLWTVTQGRPEVDPTDLANALCDQVLQEPLDYRTRLLIRDSLEALRCFWGNERLKRWLDRCPHREKILEICQEEFERPGFPTLAERLVKKTDPADVARFLREFGKTFRHSTQLTVGGSAALIMAGRLSRHTNAIGIVDEIPPEARSQPEMLEELKSRYGLTLARCQHELPSGWEQRLHSLGSFGALQVFTVDPLDIFAGKLFSKRTKDLDDLRMLAREFDKDTIARRVKDTTQALQADPTLRAQAEQNWYIVYGEPLPT